MNDLSSQLFVYMPFGVVFIIVFVCLCRLYSDRKTNERAETELENLERFTKQSGKEASDCTDRVAEIKERTGEIAERTDRARQQVESASEEISGARRDNKTAAEAISKIEEILSEAKKI